MVRFAVVGDWAPEARPTARLELGVATIINLEGPVLDPDAQKNLKPALKAGPTVASRRLPTSTDPIILSLANNHTMDFGEPGLASTLQLLSTSSILGTLGAGENSEIASAPFVFESETARVGIIAKSERQFGMASADGSGVAVLDSAVHQEIAELKSSVDHVVLLIHGGSEMVPWPSPERRQFWRSLINTGASAVVGNHAHVPSAWEYYKNGVIFYGLGNFCVDPKRWSWHPQGLWSLAPEFTFHKDNFALELKTVVVDEIDHRVNVRFSDPIELEAHLRHVSETNVALANERLLEGLWQEASMALYKKYFSLWLGFSAPRSVRGIAGLWKRFAIELLHKITGRPNPRQRAQNLLRYHLFSCEANRDVIATALGIASGELTDYRNTTSANLVSRMVRLQ